MDKNNFTFVCLILSSCYINAQKKANLVLIIADQWRGDALGCMNKEPVKTPNLDKLSSEGICFSNAVSSYPVSSPARAMMMTGMYPTHNKVVHNCNSDSAPYSNELSQSAVCWSDILKREGYSTAYIGKWHLDSPHQPYVNTSNNKGSTAWNEWCKPERRHGFDYWVAYGTYDDHLKPMYWNTTAPRDSFYYVNQWGPEYETNLAIDYLNKQKGTNKPFAMVISMNPPHTGYNLVPEQYKNMYSGLDIEELCEGHSDIPPKGSLYGNYFRDNIRNYYACISGVDENIGRIMKQLKENDQWENTIVVFASDHGVCMGNHQQIGKNIYYEEAMRIPLIISWPKKLKSRKDEKTMISFADLYPTLLSLMGYRKDIPKTVQTFDLSKTILEGKVKTNMIQPYYYIQYNEPTTGFRGLRTKRYTFVLHATKGFVDNVILFDRKKDSREMKDISNFYPKLVNSLKRELKKWLIKTEDPFAAYLID